MMQSTLLRSLLLALSLALAGGFVGGAGAIDLIITGSGLPLLSTLPGTATDAQLPHLNTLSTGLAANQCVSTDASSLLVSTGAPCGAGAGVSDGDKGDITVSGSGANWQVDAAAITNTELAQMATGTLKGRSTAGTGAPEDLAAAAVKTLLSLQNVDNTSDATKNTAVATLRNKEIAPRVCSDPGTSSPVVINADTCDEVVIPELSQNTTFSAPTGSQEPRQRLTIVITTTVPRTVTFVTGANAFSAANGLALPTFTKSSGRVEYAFAWDVPLTRWVFRASTQTTTYGILDDCLRSNGPGVEPSFRACGGGGGGSSTTSRNLPVTGIKLNDGVNPPAALDRSGLNDYLLFDAATKECVVWPFTLPDDYLSTPVVVVDYTMVSAGAAGNLRLLLDVMHLKTGVSIETNSYDSVNVCAETVLPADGQRKRLTCPLTTVDTWVAGDPIKLRLCRDAAHGGDTAGGDLAIFNSALRYTR